MIFDKLFSTKDEEFNKFSVQDYLVEKFTEMEKKNKILEKELNQTNKLLKKIFTDISKNLKENLNELKLSKKKMFEENLIILKDTLDEMQSEFEKFYDKKLNILVFDINKKIFSISERIGETFPEEQKIYAEEVNKLNEKIQSFINYEDNLNSFKLWAKSFLKSETNTFFENAIRQIMQFDVNNGNFLTHYHVKIDEIEKILKQKL